MKKILVIGGGAMGSAFTIPCIEKKMMLQLLNLTLKDL